MSPAPARGPRAALVGTLLRHELRMLLRDRRTVIFSIVLPLVVMPLLLFSGRLLDARREKKLEQVTYTYAVTGSRADLLHDLSAPAEPAAENEPRFKVEQKQVDDPAASLGRDEIDFYLEALGVEEAARIREEEEQKEEAGDDKDEDARADRRDAVPAPLVLIHFRGNRDQSSTGAHKMERRLEEVRGERRDVLLRERGFPVDPELVVPLREQNVATDAQVSGSTLGRFLTAMLLLFLFTGGSVIAVDSIAGEKERGTLETLLTTAAKRIEIVSAKLLSILAVALFISMTQVANLLVYVGLGLIPLPEGFAIAISPAAAIVLFLLFLPVAALTSSVLLMLSGRAKTYKEAQLYLLPVILAGAVPGFAAVLPGIDLRSAIVLLPVANTSVAVREILTGRFDWPMLALTWLITAAAAGWAIRATVRSLSVERLITSGGADEADWAGGAALFPRHVLRWFAVLWVVMFLVALNVEALSSMTRQVLFNVVVLFGGGSLLMIRRYRLAPREVLALRAPKAAVWLGVLVGIPAAHLVGLGVFWFANLFFPVPQKLLEKFGDTLLPQDLPVWQIYLLAAVLPGIFEEIAFRGVLLHGLHRRMRPLALCLVVGLIFGLYHVTLFRIVPTMYLGIVLTAVTLLTGSIFPAMVWHAGNNALALWAARSGAALHDLGSWAFIAAVPALAFAFWILYRNRMPYPGLRPWRQLKRPESDSA